MKHTQKNLGHPFNYVLYDETSRMDTNTKIKIYAFTE